MQLGEVVEEPVSYRKFAAMVGQSEGAVRKAVNRESIKEGLVTVGDGKKIIPSVAACEWGKELIKTEVETPAESAPAMPAEVVDSPAAEIYTPVDEVDPEESAEDAELRKKIPKGTTKTEADRMLSVLKAEKAQLELDALRGTLVSKELVQQNLTEMGIVIRDTFMNLPARSLDEIVALETRNERLLKFEEVIADALKTVVKVVGGDVMKK